MDSTLFVAFLVAVALLSLAPGPDMLFIVANAVTGGRRAGVVAALGMSTGLAVHTVAAALGLGALIQAAPMVLDGVRVAGAVFLVYLAVSTWRSSMTVGRVEVPEAPDGPAASDRGRDHAPSDTGPSDTGPSDTGPSDTGPSDRGPIGAAPAGRPRSISRVYAMATLTNLANPKVVLFYLAFFPQFLTTSTGSWPVTLQFLTLGAAFIVVGLAVDASAGMLAGMLSERVLRRGRVRRWLDRVSAAVFGGLAVRLALDTR
jgi:threonine/homoserine/homoserine lactone efflux protein